MTAKYLRTLFDGFMCSRFFLLCASSNVRSSRVSNFTNQGGEFGEVRIDPCPELPCIFKKGTPLKLQVDFVAGKFLQPSKKKSKKKRDLCVGNQIQPIQLESLKA